MYLGERYGYFLLNDAGYNYVTGGGGIVLSRLTLKKLSATNCTCPTIHSPDDMILATCLSQFAIQATHSSNFHQARPIDYPAAVVVDKTNIISFHKHWQIDPYDVYAKWFKENDENFLFRNSIKIESNEQQQQQQQRPQMMMMMPQYNNVVNGGRSVDEVQIINGLGGGSAANTNDGREIFHTHSDCEMNHTDL